jgi:hypothetical protein
MEAAEASLTKLKPDELNAPKRSWPEVWAVLLATMVLLRLAAVDCV